MKKIIVSLLALGFFVPLIAVASSCTPFFTVQGGTGNCGLATGAIPFGGSTNTSAFATSSVFTWSNSLSRLSFTNGSSTSQSLTGFLRLDTLGTAAGAIIAVDPTGRVIATTTPAGVTSVTGTWPIISSGGATPAISFAGLSTTSPWTNGQLAMVASNSLLTGISTSSITVDSPLTTSGTAGYMVGGSSFHIGCSTCTSGTVNSGTTGQLPYYAANGTALTATSGVFLSTQSFFGIGTTTPDKKLTVYGSTSGGDVNFIRAPGALGGVDYTALKLTLLTTDNSLGVNGVGIDFYGATSSPANAVGNQLGFIGAERSTNDRSAAIILRPNENGAVSTNMFAYVDGGNKNFLIATSTPITDALSVQNKGNLTNVVQFYSNTGAPLLNLANTGLLTAISASTTNLSASGSFFVPTTTALPAGINTQIAVNTTAASTSLQFGTAAAYATSSVSFTWSTTTPSTAATDTAMIILGPRGSKFTSMACRSVGGTANVQIGNGTASSTMVISSTGTVSLTSLTSNNSFNAWQSLFIAIGTYSANTVSQVACGFGREYTY